MESRGTGGVTIVTLLDDSKADTLATVVGAWRELDTGGRPVGVVALAQGGAARALAARIGTAHFSTGDGGRKPTPQSSLAKAEMRE